MKFTEKIVRTLHITVYVSDLIFFLKQKEVLKFFEEYVNWPKIMIADNPEFWISDAFMWRKTPEGYDFWDKINKQWLDVLRRDMPKNVVYENIFDVK